MVYNDTATRSGIIQFCEQRTGLGDTRISGDVATLQKFTVWANQWYDKVVLMILKAQDSWDFDDSNKSNYPILTTGLVAAQGKYNLPDGILKIKRVEISYDGINWAKAEPIDIGELGIATNEASLDSHFSTTSPVYDPQYDAIQIIPRPETSVSNALKIWIARAQDAFTPATTSTAPGFDQQFHPMIALGMCLEYAVEKGLTNKNDIAAQLSDYEARLEKYYGGKVIDSPMHMKPAFIDYD